MQSNSDERYYRDQREGFRRIADQAERAAGRSYRNTLIAHTARAAENLVGTERAEALISDSNLNTIYRVMSQTHDTLSAGVLGDLDKMLDNSTLNKPLGSGLSDDEWQHQKDRVQAARAFLGNAGYTDYEIAAALAYGRYLIRQPR